MTLSVDGVAKRVTRPVLRYHGGKWRLAPWIIQHFPKHKVYAEPFGGAASVLLRKERSYAEVYNDLDNEVVNLFCVLRDPEQSVELRRLLELTPFARREFELSYVASDDPIEQARRTMVRSFMGFGSNAHNRKTGFRSNTTRPTTIPAHDWRNWPGTMPEIVERLRGVVIENRVAIDVIRHYDGQNTLIYADPPYVHRTRKVGQVGNYRYEMTDDDHRELAQVLHECQGMVVVSGYPSALYDELYGDWKRVDRTAFADGAQKRTECLWLSPNVEVSLTCQNG